MNEQQDMQYNVQMDAPPTGTPVSPAFEIIKKRASSGVFILGAILFIVVTACQTISSFFVLDMTGIEYLINSEYELMMLLPSETLAQIYSVILALVIIMIILVLVPMILNAIGLGIFTAQARKAQPGSRKGYGLGFVKASAIVVSVYIGLAMLSTLVIFFVLLNIRSLYWNNMSPWIISLVADLVVLAVMIFAMVYEIQLIRTCTRVQLTLQDGRFPDKPLSMYVIVMNYIMIVLSLLMLIYNIAVGSFSIVSIITTVVSMVASILITVALTGTRREIESYRA